MKHFLVYWFLVALLILCLLKVLVSGKMTISMIAIELMGASFLTLVGLGLLVENLVLVSMVFISLFVCEGVIALSLFSSPMVAGGPAPRELSSCLL